MQERRFELAQHFIDTAEIMMKQWPSNEPLAYTPEMARAELTQLTASADKTSTPSSAPAAASSQEAQRLMLKARQALAHGDVATASEMLTSVEQFEIDFKSIGDSPATVRAMIARQNELGQLAQAQDRSYNAAAASFLLTQAEALIYYRDFDTAEMLIEQAKKFPVEFNENIGQPEKLIAILNSARSAQATTQPESNPKAEVMKLLSQAQLAMDQEQWQKAKAFVDQAKTYELGDDQFAANESRPWQMELKIQNALNRQSFDPEVIRTTYNESSNPVVQANYDPANDTTRNIQVGATAMDSSEAEFNPIPNDAIEFYETGLQALATGDRDSALTYFQKAWNNRDYLEGRQRKMIKDQLDQLLPEGTVAPTSVSAAAAATESVDEQDEIAAGQQAMFRKLQSDVFRERAKAENLLESNPREALEKMTMVRGRIAQSELDAESQRPLLTIIDRDITEMQKYIEQNLPDIINDETNAARKDEVERRQQRRLDVEYQIQKLVEDFNRLVDEQRFAEAQVVVRQANDLAPDSEIVALLREKAKFLIRVTEMNDIRERKEDGVYQNFRSTEDDLIPWNYDDTVVFGDTEEYSRKAKLRMSRQAERQYDSEEERRIWNILRNERVQGEYRGTLAEAMDQLAMQSGVNIVFDDMALAAEGVQKDRMVDVPIRSPISLKSALEVILSSAGLVFVVDSEVIKVTSKDTQNAKLINKTYYIGDLIMPMSQNPDPLQLNFMQPNMPAVRSGGGSMNALGANTLQGAGPTSQLAMAQQMAGNDPSNPFAAMTYNGGYNDGPQTGVPTFARVGGQRFGGVTEADFQPLIDLIQNTIQSDSWLDTGTGLGTIQAFVPNLSLIVSQTQEVQDEIQDLLKKLRELNDVQIVIEVRFITLRDEFFERVGIDFDFSLEDQNGNIDPNADRQPKSTVVGRSPVETTPFTSTQDLDLQFVQSSFTAAQPLFGGFDLTTAANFGFAILSDIEVYFLIQASKGDQRSNIMQAPTVTMFNGQSASVSDGANRPFVTSVIPVVGDFAVAHQPVITILPDGTNLNVQAVVSDDRRFVRLNLVPFFSQVTDVQTFTFDGSTTTQRSTDSVLDDLLDAVDGNGDDNVDPEFETTTQGITVQLPVLAFTTVNTVVSVPDGGTVLMGGVKRMAEGRSEAGVPFLSNIPYVNRLFKNVGIGHETSNLMMMVTPRIIIQKELEEDQVGLSGN